jgi:2-keto-3-deoxy-L-rhamnonate aldolase RhmA
MGIINQLNHPDYLAMVDQVINTCQKHRKFSGISGKNITLLREYSKRGVKLLQWGTDVSIFMDAINKEMKN